MNVLLSKGRLLDVKGNLAEAGFAFSLVKEYRRSDIKAKKSRIKEWDYYYIGNEEYGIALTIADNSYMGMASISFMDFVNKDSVTKSYIQLFTDGSIIMPPHSAMGDIIYERKKFSMSFLHTSYGRRLICAMKNFKDKEDFYCVIDLKETTNGSMVIATPFDIDQHFYYNQKINCMEASGYFSIGLNKREFSNADTRAVLDWGRGVWPYKNSWYWSSASGIDDNGDEIGFNLGYGFGNNKYATENMFFYKKRAYKLNDCKIEHCYDDKGNIEFLKPWKFSSSDGQIEMIFTPILNRHANMNLLVLQSNQNQVFGKFNGYMYFGDDKVEIKDLMGFAEKVINKW